MDTIVSGQALTLGEPGVARNSYYFRYVWNDIANNLLITQVLRYDIPNIRKVVGLRINAGPPGHAIGFARIQRLAS